MSSHWVFNVSRTQKNEWINSNRDEKQGKKGKIKFSLLTTATLSIRISGHPLEGCHHSYIYPSTHVQLLSVPKYHIVSILINFFFLKKKKTLWEGGLWKSLELLSERIMPTFGLSCLSHMMKNND